LIRSALDWRIPLFAICLGMQELNVALGGDLHQHLEEDASMQDHGGLGRRTEHSISIRRDTLLADVLGRNTLEVNSSHHQGIARIGAGLKVSAKSDDGLAEAIELEDKSRFVLGVQWHPELMLDRPEQRQLFISFVESCCSAEKVAL
jgi:putative glutamine amidotransferase